MPPVHVPESDDYFLLPFQLTEFFQPNNVVDKPNLRNYIA